MTWWKKVFPFTVGGPPTVYYQQSKRSNQSWLTSCHTSCFPPAATCAARKSGNCAEFSTPLQYALDFASIHAKFEAERQLSCVPVGDWSRSSKQACFEKISACNKRERNRISQMK